MSERTHSQMVVSRVSKKRKTASKNSKNEEWMTGPSGRKIKVGGPTWRKLFPGQSPLNRKSASRSPPKQKFENEYTIASKLGKSPKINDQGATFVSKSVFEVGKVNLMPGKYQVVSLTPREVRNFKVAERWGYSTSPVVRHSGSMWVISIPSKTIGYPFLEVDNSVQAILNAVQTLQNKGYQLYSDLISSTFLGAQQLKFSVPMIRRMKKVKAGKDFDYGGLFDQLINDTRQHLISKGGKTMSDINNTLLGLADEFMWWMVHHAPEELTADHQNFRLGVAKWLKTKPIEKSWNTFISRPTWKSWQAFTKLVWDKVGPKK